MLFLGALVIRLWDRLQADVLSNGAFWLARMPGGKQFSGLLIDIKF
jgi:hypothetical protein